ncbi:MAG TPA: hypothetical protein GX743_04980 [Actinomycetales bacterium]|nr:hypothetical protein [Actinomycetales bacterium]
MTDGTLETEGYAGSQDWSEKVCDALGVSRDKLDAVKPIVSDLVQKVANTHPFGDASMAAFLVGFAAAKDGDFSPESVTARVHVVEGLLEG